MPKRCERISDGKPCPYLASDGTCLCYPIEINEKCPAKETVGHEEKDFWMLKRRYLQMKTEDLEKKLKQHSLSRKTVSQYNWVEDNWLTVKQVIRILKDEGLVK